MPATGAEMLFTLTTMTSRLYLTKTQNKSSSPAQVPIFHDFSPYFAQRPNQPKTRVEDKDCPALGKFPKSEPVAMLVIHDPRCSEYGSSMRPEQPSRVVKTAEFLRASFPAWTWQEPEADVSDEVLLL